MKYTKGRFKYQLVEDVHHQTKIFPEKDIRTLFAELTRGGYLTVYTGYAWDGPSGPTIDSKSSIRGSMLHDVLYMLIRKRWLDPKHRKEADRILRDVCIEDGMWEFRARVWYVGVRKGAWWAAKPAHAKKVLEAP